MGKNKMMMVGEMGPAASASEQEPDSGSRADGKQSTDTMGSAPTPSDSASEQQPYMDMVPVQQATQQWQR